MSLDPAAFGGASGVLKQVGGTAASDLTSTVGISLAPPPATSPAGDRIAAGIGLLSTGLGPVGPKLSTSSDQVDGAVQQGTAAIENQDENNAGDFKNGPNPTNPSEGTKPGPAKPNLGGLDEGLLDPDSIDDEAKSKAEDMLGADQATDMMQQTMQAGMQGATQALQGISQQLSQFSNKLGEMVGKVGEQVGQVAGKVSDMASKAATPDLDVGGFDPGAFSGGGVGGGFDPGTTTPAGIGTPISAMTTSSALQPSPLKPPAAPTTGSTGTMGGRMPMVPMMPMAGRGRGGNSESVKRNTEIFPDSKLYDPPPTVEQTFGANPEITSEEPPFGDTENEPSRGKST